MSSGFTAEEFEPDAAAATASQRPRHHGSSQRQPARQHRQRRNTATTPSPWPVLGAAAYHGLAGEVVTTISPQTEADPVALLLQYLVYCRQRDRPRAVLSGRARTGTSPTCSCCWWATRPRRARASRPGASATSTMTADPDWAANCIQRRHEFGRRHPPRHPRPGLHHAEGRISVMTDPGVDDKRLLLDEREFYSALAVMQREGNIAQPHRPRRLGLPAGAANADQEHPHPRHQRPSSRSSATSRSTSCGRSSTTPRWRTATPTGSCIACVHRSKMLPFGGDALDADRPGDADQDRDRDRPQRRARDHDRRPQGAVGASLSAAVGRGSRACSARITARAEAQTMRLALIYALLDGAGEIDRVHLEAALAVWAFCEASTRFIFGDVTGDTIADAILRALRSAGATGMTRTEINDAVQQQSPQRGYRPGAGIADAARQGAVSYHTATTRPAWAADRDLVRDLREIQPAINTH